MAKDNPVINPYDNTGSGYEMSTEVWVDNKEIESFTRVVQQDIVPAAIKERLLGQLFAKSNLAWEAFTITNSTSAIVRSTLTNSEGNLVIGIPNIAVYFGISSILQADTSNQWPNSTLAYSLPVFINISDYGRSDGNNQVATTLIRNNSGADIEIVYACQWRLLVQPGNNPTS